MSSSELSRWASITLACEKSSRSKINRPSHGSTRDHEFEDRLSIIFHISFSISHLPLPEHSEVRGLTAFRVPTLVGLCVRTASGSDRITAPPIVFGKLNVTGCYPLAVLTRVPK